MSFYCEDGIDEAWIARELAKPIRSSHKEARAPLGAKPGVTVAVNGQGPLPCGSLDDAAKETGEPEDESACCDGAERGRYHSSDCPGLRPVSLRHATKTEGRS